MGTEPLDRITLVDVRAGTPFPAAPDSSLVLSSTLFTWPGIIVEWHKLDPQELPQHYVQGHGIAVNIGARPISFGWKDDDKRVDGVMNPGEFHLLTDGELNTPRWSGMFDEVSLVLDPRFVAGVAREGLPARSVEFATQRSTSDLTVAFYAEAFRAELANKSLNGPLYAETLTIGLTLHLLSHYAVARPRMPYPRGKLTSFQLRRVVELIMARLGEEVSVRAMAEEANVSPFYFARMFRKTLGVTPHRFVLRHRIQKSLHLIREGKLTLSQIATESGFYDQAHFTHAFRTIVGTTPAEYADGNASDASPAKGLRRALRVRPEADHKDSASSRPS
jgi:AraC family transcriptional regulator